MAHRSRVQGCMKLRENVGIGMALGFELRESGRVQGSRVLRGVLMDFGGHWIDSCFRNAQA